MAQIKRTVSVTARPDNSYELYQTISRTFWNAERQLQQRVDPFSAAPSPYISPLDKADPLYQKYFQVDHVANEYITYLDNRQNSPLLKGDSGGFFGQSWTLPPVLYLGGLAAFTIGDYANAQKYFSCLLKNHADYKRHSYIGDNYTSDPDFAQPVKPAVTKLLFYCEMKNRARQQAETPANTFTDFQNFSQSSLEVLSTQIAFAEWLANRPNKYQRREFHEDNYGDEPDQLRASVLPKTGQLIEDGWRQLFPAALKKSGALAMRAYLRTLLTNDSSLQDIVTPRLAEVDKLIIASYFAQAKVLLAKDDFAGTRSKYKQIIAEYPDSDASHLAETQLPKVVPVAVNYYQKVADDNFHPAAKIGVPQDKAADYYSRMYQEDKDGPKADLALYNWARALGTSGKTKEEVNLLQQHLKEFPKSKVRAEAMYLLGFTYCNQQLRDYKDGIPLLLQVAKDYPQSAEAPEALWNAAFVLGWNKQYQQAVPLLQQLKKEYPKSPRAKWADEWISKYTEGM
jgi:TolA-binding protein